MEELRRTQDSQLLPEPGQWLLHQAAAGLCEDDSAAQLFADFAFHNGFVSLQQIVAWQQEAALSNSSLAEYLISRGELEPEDCRALQEVVARAMKRGTFALSRVPPMSVDSPALHANDSETVTFHGPVRTDQPVIAVLGDYEILKEIARGGMGVVYKALQTKLNRLVALKVIRAGEFAGSEEIKRFRIEATAAAKLDHPNIVPVYEVGQADGMHFFSMALVEGESLKARVFRDGPFTPTKAATLMLQAAQAVGFAHAKGIIHRDIKPHNLLLDRSDTVRVADFGLAKDVGSDSDLTATGQVIGTPSYMAPEQAAGKLLHVGIASDVYSLGATLYFMLTGRPPFQAGSTVETIRQVLEVSPLSPRKLNPAVARDLETICLHCLRKEPAKRYASADEFAKDLQRWLAHEPIVTRPVSLVEKLWLWARRHPAVTALLGVLLLTVIGAAVISWQQRKANLERIASATLLNDQSRAAAHVDSLINAPATGVPYALQLVTPLAQHAMPILQHHFNAPASSPSARLRAGIALAQLGESHTDYLVDSIRTAPAGECGNLVAALATASNAAELCRRRVQSFESQLAPDRIAMARYAIVALYLRDSTLASEMCATRPDMIRRTNFAEVLPQWHGDLGKLLNIVRDNKDEQLIGTVLLGLADVAPDELPPGVLSAWTQWLSDVLPGTPNPFTRSACCYLAQKWVLKLSLPSSGKASDNLARWQVNSLGLTMIRCDPGSFTRTILEAGSGVHQDVQLTRPFFLAQQETSMAAFRSFLADQYPDPAALPMEWKSDSSFAKLSADGPACFVSWEDAARFCNWLSDREHLERAYVIVNGTWIGQPKANGYRLPTAAEWEYACRANTTTTYYFGNDADRLSRYVVYNTRRPAVCGSRAPNPWGFFEMLGNVHEWCSDGYVEEIKPSPATIDPIGASEGRTRVLMGGSFQNGPAILSLDLRHWGNPQARSYNNGLRVARTATP